MGRYFYEALKEYADSTTIHGISYIFKNGISILERLIWIAAVVTGIFFAIYLSTFSYVDWQNSPVTTTVLTTAKPIRNISFPAITICAQVTNTPLMQISIVPVLVTFDKSLIFTQMKIVRYRSLDTWIYLPRYI